MALYSMMSAMARSKAGIAIQQRMSEVKLTQGALARGLRRSQTWVSQSLLDDTDRTVRRLWVGDSDRYHRLLDLLKVSPTEFERLTGINLGTTQTAPEDQLHLESEDLRGGARTVPVYDLLSAGPGGDGGTVIDTVDIPDSFKGQHAAYEVVGDSMAPDIPNGARVVIKVQDYASPGNEIVCWVPDHGMLVKYLDRIEGEEYVLTSYNPNYRPIWTREIVIYGVVREIRLRRKFVNGNHGPN